MNYIVNIPAECYEELTKAIRNINPYAPNPLPATVPAQNGYPTAKEHQSNGPNPASHPVETD